MLSISNDTDFYSNSCSATAFRLQYDIGKSKPFLFAVQCSMFNVHWTKSDCKIKINIDVYFDFCNHFVQPLFVYLNVKDTEKKQSI